MSVFKAIWVEQVWELFAIFSKVFNKCETISTLKVKDLRLLPFSGCGALYYLKVSIYFQSSILQPIWFATMWTKKTTFNNIYVYTDAYMYKKPINEKWPRVWKGEGRKFMGKFWGKQRKK